MKRAGANALERTTSADPEELAAEIFSAMSQASRPAFSIARGLRRAWIVVVVAWALFVPLWLFFEADTACFGREFDRLWAERDTVSAHAARMFSGYDWPLLGGLYAVIVVVPAAALFGLGAVALWIGRGFRSLRRVD